MVFLDLIIKLSSENLETLYIGEPDFFEWKFIIRYYIFLYYNPLL